MAASVAAVSLVVITATGFVTLLACRHLKNPIAPTRVDKAAAPVKEIQLFGADADLNDLPSMMVSARDSGRYIPSGITFVKDPDTGVGNMSLHRQQIMGRDKSGFVMLPRHARRVYDKYSERGQPTPVAIPHWMPRTIFAVLVTGGGNSSIRRRRDARRSASRRRWPVVYADLNFDC